MADDLTTTNSAPAGLVNATKLVTDENASRGHMFVYKQAVSADGDAALVPADVANGLDVDVTRLPAATTTIGSVHVVPRVSGGTNAHSLVSAATANATLVKGSAGQLFGWQLTNTNATAFRYVKLYNTASAPTAGAGTPVLRLGLPPAGGAVLALATGIAFSAGIGYTIVAGAADADATAVGAGEVLVNLAWF